MKTTLLLTAACLFGGLQLFAQENEIPTVGNVGIGTTAPTEKLDVHGNIKVDSTITVGDSLVVSQSARVGEDFRVDGNAYFKANASIDGSLTLSNVSEAVGLTEAQMLLLRSDGAVQKIGTVAFAQMSYSIGCAGLAGVGIVNPMWSNGPG